MPTAIAMQTATENDPTPTPTPTPAHMLSQACLGSFGVAEAAIQGVHDVATDSSGADVLRHGPGLHWDLHIRQRCRMKTLERLQHLEAPAHRAVCASILVYPPRNRVCRACETRAPLPALAAAAALEASGGAQIACTQGPAANIQESHPRAHDCKTCPQMRDWISQRRLQTLPLPRLLQTPSQKQGAPRLQLPHVAMRVAVLPRPRDCATAAGAHQMC